MGIFNEWVDKKHILENSEDFSGFIKPAIEKLQVGLRNGIGTDGVYTNIAKEFGLSQEEFQALVNTKIIVKTPEGQRAIDKNNLANAINFRHKTPDPANQNNWSGMPFGRM